LIAVPSLMALSLMIYSHRERAESLEEIGFTRKHFLHALRLLVAPMLAAALLLLLVGYWFKSMRNVDDVLLKLATLPLWGLVQQYVLQGFKRGEQAEVEAMVERAAELVREWLGHGDLGRLINAANAP